MILVRLAVIGLLWRLMHTDLTVCTKKVKYDDIQQYATAFDIQTGCGGSAPRSLI